MYRIVYIMNKIFCMTADDLLDSLPDKSVDCIITDPPYGLGISNFEIRRAVMRDGIVKPGENYKRVSEDWDKDIPIRWLDKVQRVLKPYGNVLICTGDTGIGDYMYKCVRELKWRRNALVTLQKENPPPNFTGRALTQDCEFLLWFCPDGEKWTYNRKVAKQFGGGVNLNSVWKIPIPHGIERFHPTQKPVVLMDRIVRLFSKEKDIILDPFCGSGTTLYAARNANRNYIGGDISPEYVEKATKRLAKPYTEDMFYKIGEKE